jgi:hypothetical protein
MGEDLVAVPELQFRPGEVEYVTGFNGMLQDLAANGSLPMDMYQTAVHSVIETNVSSVAEHHASDTLQLTVDSLALGASRLMDGEAMTSGSVYEHILKNPLLDDIEIKELYTLANGRDTMLVGQMDEAQVSAYIVQQAGFAIDRAMQRQKTGNRDSKAVTLALLSFAAGAAIQRSSNPSDGNQNSLAMAATEQLLRYIDHIQPSEGATQG